MIKFGPAGNSEAFYEAGYKHTYQAMAWLKEMGLNAYEYSCGRGVRLKEETAEKIRQEAERCGITLSLHAPYFINLANADTEKFDKNVEYFAESSKAAKLLGAQRIVFHPGSPAKEERSQAFARCRENFIRMLNIMDEMGNEDLIYCPETMGKINQLGDLQEVIELVRLDERVLPTIDFGHLHTRGIGAINTTEDFEAIVRELKQGIGLERLRKIHVHFSKIEYTAMGEKRHRTFDEEGFGPDFALLAPVLVREKMEPTIICESKGTMAKDALAMKWMYEQAIREEENQNAER